MERTEEFKAGDRNSGNGNFTQQVEATTSGFEEGRPSSAEGEVRPMKDGEPFVYGDSRPDDRNDQGGFASIDDSPMMNTTREDLPEVHTEDPAFLASHANGQNEEIRPMYDKTTDGEGAVLVEREGV